jgi:hypothetical protein
VASETTKKEYALPGLIEERMTSGSSGPAESLKTAKTSL